jgi:tetratricopeptide (TPR) repeat protein
MKYQICLLFLILIPGTARSSEQLDEAVHLYGKGQYQQAANLLQKLAQTSPKDAELRFWLGKSYGKIREWKSAVQEMEKAVQLEPSNARYHLWLGRACGDQASHAFFTTAWSLARRVIKEFKIARDLAPKDIDIRFDLLEYFIQAPEIVGGGNDKAEAEALTIAQLDPSKGYIARAAIFRNDKKWDKAKEEMIRATRDYPKNADAYKDLADYLFDRQDFEGTLDYGKKALELNNQSKRTQLLVAAAETNLRKNLDHNSKIFLELAAGTLNDEDPSFEEVYYWQGECFLAKGDRIKAREAFKSALAFNPEYSRAKDALSKTK